MLADGARDIRSPFNNWQFLGEAQGGYHSGLWCCVSHADLLIAFCYLYKESLTADSIWVTITEKPTTHIEGRRDDGTAYQLYL